MKAKVVSSSRLVEDRDKEYVFENGIAAVAESRFKYIVNLLLSIGVELVEGGEDDVWIFQLPEKYTKQAVTDMIRAEKVKRKKLYTELVPKQIMIESAKIARQIARTIDLATGKKVLGKVKNHLTKKMSECIVEINAIIIKMARGGESLASGIRKIKVQIEHLKHLASQAVILDALGLDRS